MTHYSPRRLFFSHLGKSYHRPRVLYVNPTGCNPTGTLLPEERREEIYRICSEHDLVRRRGNKNL